MEALRRKERGEGGEGKGRDNKKGEKGGGLWRYI